MVVNNPNNWHWVDKNCIDWTKKYFDDKLVGVKAVKGEKIVEVTSVSSVEGDVEVSQRKGKVISLFDLKIALNIGGESNGSFKGSIIIPELAYDTEPDEIQFDVSIFNENEANEEMRMVAKKELVPKIRDILSKFGSDLIANNIKDIQLEQDKVNSNLTKQNQEQSVKGVQNVGTSSSKNNVKLDTIKATPLSTSGGDASNTKATSSSSGNVPKYNTSTIHLEPVFNTTAEQLYITLLDPARIAAWTRSPPEIPAFPPPEGSTFKLFGGSISGKLTKLVPNERIVQLWRVSDWKEGHFAQIDIQLVQGSGDTKMVVKWSGVPIGEEERVKENFESYYVRSIKLTFGFGTYL